MRLPSFGHRSRLKIGLLGGSFNPSHSGHVHISEMALKEMGLDQVWWLVSPQNPHKSSRDMAPLEKRFSYAQKLTEGHKKITVTRLETRLKTQYSAHSLAQIQKRYRRFSFVWLMGADNLTHFHTWERWTWICRHFPIGVFHRPYYSRQSLSSRAAKRYDRYRVAPKKAPLLLKKPLPGWAFFTIRGKDISATQLRARSTSWLADT